METVGKGQITIRYAPISTPLGQLYVAYRGKAVCCVVLVSGARGFERGCARKLGVRPIRDARLPLCMCPSRCRYTLAFPSYMTWRHSEGGCRQAWEVPYAMTHTICARCHRRKPYLNDNGLCEICEEYDRMIAHETLRDVLICSHCGQTFTEKKFEQHRWRCYYRDRSLVIKGSRKRR